MKIKLGFSITEQIPAIRYTVILVKNADNLRKISSLSQLLRGTAVVTKNDLKKAERKNLFSQVTEITTASGATFLEGYLLGNRLKKIMAGKEIEGKNNLINLVNYLSLKHFLPLFGFDLDQCERDYTLNFYLPKKGKKSPDLNFSAETKHFVIWFPNLGNWPDEQIDSFIAEIDLCLNKYMQTRIAEVFHLDAEHREIDLGYESELEQDYKANQEQKEPAPEEIPPASPASFQEGDILAENEKFTLPPETPDIHLELKKWLTEIVAEEFPELTEKEPAEDNSGLIEVEIPKEAAHGDLSTNIAMKLAKILGQPPQDIAQKILQALQKKQSAGPGLLEKVELVPPGFINFHFSLAYFQTQLANILAAREKYGRQNLGHGDKVMIEWGSLNIAKPFGAHHFMTTIIGNTLVNLYRVIGYQVLSADFPGDWGTQFGKSIYAYRHWGDQAVVEKDPVNELLKLYVKFHEEAEKDPSLEDAAREEFRKLEAGDPENKKLWQWIVDVSTRDLYSIYQTLGVKHDRSYPESKYNESCRKILQRGKELGVFTEGEKGAFIVNLETEKLPTAMVQKGDGATLYVTRDLASIEDRLTSEPDLKKIIYVVDNAQSLNFKQLFAIANRLHQADPAYPITEFKHVAFGRMGFADSSMSTRKGNIIQGRDIIKEAHDRAEKIVQQKLLENGTQLSPSETRHLVHGLAIGAIKYAMLCQAPESDLTFDWDKVISFEGNSAPYLQYSLARAHSILRKAYSADTASEITDRPAKTGKQISEDQISLFSLANKPKPEIQPAAAEQELSPFGLPAEQALLRLLVQFPDRIAAAALNYKPNIVTTYLHEMAQTFNTFYGAVPVLKCQREDLKEARLNLVRATVQILKNGLQILGIATFERM